MTKGLGVVMTSLYKTLQNQHRLFLLYDTTEQNILHLLANQKIANYSNNKHYFSIIFSIADLKAFYLNPILYQINKEYKKEVLNYLNSIDLIDTIKLAVYLTFLVLFFLVYLRITLSKFDHYLWKTRNLLRMVPAPIMISRFKEIQLLIKKNS
jgi:hypothetical protein